MKKKFLLVSLLITVLFLSLSLTVYAGRSGGGEGGDDGEDAVSVDTSVGLNFDVDGLSDCSGTAGEGTWEWHPKGSAWCADNNYSTNVLVINKITVIGKEADGLSYGLRVPLNTTIIVHGENLLIGGASKNSLSCGLYGKEKDNETHNRITIIGDGALYAYGVKGTESAGIYVNANKGGLFISGSSELLIEAHGGIATSIRSSGIRVYDGCFEINNSKAHVTVSVNKDTSESLSDGRNGLSIITDVYLKAGYLNIADVETGIKTINSIRITGCNVTINADGNALSALKDFDMSSGSLTATSDKASISVAKNCIINGGTVNCNSGNYYSIHANNKIYINGGNVSCNHFPTTVWRSENGKDDVRVCQSYWYSPVTGDAFNGSDVSLLSNGIGFSYSLAGAKPIGNAVYVFVPTGAARLKYGDELYYTDALTDRLNLFKSYNAVLSMPSYTYAGTLPTPSWTDLKESIVSIDYYYNTDKAFTGAHDWVDSSTALDTGVYYMYAVVKYKDSNTESDTVYSATIGPVQFTVSKATPEKIPDIPEIVGITDQSLTIKTDFAYEYAVTDSANEPGSWSSSTKANVVFSGPNGMDISAKKLYLHYRIAETRNYLPSVRRCVELYTAYTAPSADLLTLDYSAETLSYDSKIYELFSDAEGKNPISSGSSFTRYISDYGKAAQNLYFRVKSTSEHGPDDIIIEIINEYIARRCYVVPASAMTKITVTARPRTPDAIPASGITAAQDSLTAAGKAGNEYAVTSATQTAAPKDGWRDTFDFSGLSDATEYIIWQRVKSTATAPHSFSAKTNVLTLVATPIFTPAAGKYNGKINVTLSCATDGAAIRYTLDGSEPTASSALYNGEIAVSVETEIKAKAFRNGIPSSKIATALYTIVYDIKATAFPPYAGTVTGGGEHKAETEVTLTATPKEGFHFVKWMTDVTVLGLGDSYSLTATKNICIFALFAEDNPLLPTIPEVHTYTVRFAANGGSGRMPAIPDLSGSYTLPECGFTAPAGKQFSCWEIGDTRFNAGASVELTADTVLYAIWEDKPAEPEIKFAAGTRIVSDGDGSIIAGVSDKWDISKDLLTDSDLTQTVVSADGTVRTSGSYRSGDTVRLTRDGVVVHEYTIAVTGDVNGDGKVNTADYILMRKSILGLSDLNGWQTAAADIDSDGKAKPADYISIRRYLLKQTNTLR